MTIYTHIWRQKENIYITTLFNLFLAGPSSAPQFDPSPSAAVGGAKRAYSRGVTPSKKGKARRLHRPVGSARVRFSSEEDNPDSPDSGPDEEDPPEPESESPDEPPEAFDPSAPIHAGTYISYIYIFDGHTIYMALYIWCQKENDRNLFNLF